MSVGALDYRRTDLRTNILENPYWITSKFVNCADGSTFRDVGTVLFTFNTAGLYTIIKEVILEITTGVSTSGVLDIGYGTLDSATTCTITDPDGFIKTADITEATAGIYGPAGGGSVWLTAAAAKTFAVPRVFAGSATYAATPVVLACFSAAAITSGIFRLHMLIANVPGVA